MRTSIIDGAPVVIRCSESSLSAILDGLEAWVEVVRPDRLVLLDAKRLEQVARAIRIKLGE